ncbi:hypothetical protein MB02_07870 [Croceicoccus estronivorus]|nr:hypothetical protein MB02_07870 [Croceicoccus estronivorus]
MSFEEAGRSSIVYVVDDDAGVRASLVELLEANSISAHPFSGAGNLLDALDNLQPGLLLVDIRMPDRSGIDLLSDLRAADCYWPVIIMTAHGEIPLAVRAMRLGAFDFLEKPFSNDVLQATLKDGFQMLHETVKKSDRARMARRLLLSLSPRQRQVFEGVVNGLTSKQIAQLHGLSPRTVEAYRLDMMNKLQLTQLVDLMELKAVLRECQLAI